METIRPSSDLRNKYNEIATFCKESREPTYITVNGRGDTVLISVAEYNQMVAELSLLRGLAEAEEDVLSNRLQSSSTVFNNLRSTLQGRT